MVEIHQFVFDQNGEIIREEILDIPYFDLNPLSEDERKQVVGEQILKHINQENFLLVLEILLIIILRCCLPELMFINVYLLFILLYLAGNILSQLILMLMILILNYPMEHLIILIILL